MSILHPSDRAPGKFSSSEWFEPLRGSGGETQNAMHSRCTLIVNVLSLAFTITMTLIKSCWTHTDDLAATCAPCLFQAFCSVSRERKDFAIVGPWQIGPMTMRTVMLSPFKKCRWPRLFDHRSFAKNLVEPRVFCKCLNVTSHFAIPSRVVKRSAISLQSVYLDSGFCENIHHKPITFRPWI